MDLIKRAAMHWDRMAARPNDRQVLRWWESRILRQLVDENWWRATGARSAGEYIRRKTGRNSLGLGLSIGCGTAEDEILLLKEGVLERIILCDISDEQLDRAMSFAEKQEINLNRIIRTNHIDLTKDYHEALDLIYWRHSLHHMLDTRSTIEWCRANLTKNGAIYCNDACPPNYMQWDEKVLDWVELYRASLPLPYLISPFDRKKLMPTKLTPPGIEHWKAIDPTECADSANIIPAIQDLAPCADIAFLGGCIYGLALEDIICNFHDEDEKLLIDAMLLDRFMASAGMNFYFACVINRRDFR